MLEAAPDDLFGSIDEDGKMTSNSLAQLGRRVASALGLAGVSTDDEPAESGADAGGSPSANDSDPGSDPGSTMERDKLINEITSNSEIERESLEGMGDTCLQSTHEHVVGDDDGGTDPTGNGGTNDVAEQLAAIEEKMVTEDELEDVVANAQQQNEKEERVERIIANSAEYDSDDKADLLDTPDAVLEDIEAGISSNGTLPGATGAAERATANAGAGDDDPSEYSDGMIGGDL
jgi:hypothetical protein